ncbi:hypothetical protein Q31a_08700 [Aureliella helgolandensis]|uniref:Uncharacterized protein n=1 Tax=Aureliella helgolandensis TaxID=2527968 RepID=A0A518G1Y3_9BACT|nr:hypothetical protein Q31a_08700 [Aureliella helgolandensis]
MAEFGLASFLFAYLASFAVIYSLDLGRFRGREIFACAVLIRVILLVGVLVGRSVSGWGAGGRFTTAKYTKEAKGGGWKRVAEFGLASFLFAYLASFAVIYSLDLGRFRGREIFACAVLICLILLVGVLVGRSVSGWGAGGRFTTAKYTKEAKGGGWKRVAEFGLASFLFAYLASFAVIYPGAEDGSGG